MLSDSVRPPPLTADAVTATMALVLGCARDESGFNPGAIAVAIDLLQHHEKATSALAMCMLDGITGSTFYDFWQNVDDAGPHVAELARCFQTPARRAL